MTPAFNRVFPARLRNSLVQAVQRAWSNAQELHDSSAGSNAATFGYNLFHFHVHELRALAASLELHVNSVDGAFRLHVGEFVIGCYRVIGSDNIWSAFPSNEGASTELIQQPCLPGLEFNLLDARRIVLAHMGDVEVGLRGVYACIPVRQVGDRIVEWGAVTELWRADNMQDPVAPDPQDSPPPASSDERVPDEETTRPTLRRKPRTDEDEQDR